MSTTNQEYIRVSEAKARYLSGAMSLRWWYRQIEEGKLAHFRAGGAVLLRPADVEAFISEMFRDKKADDGEEEPPPQPVQAATPQPRRSVRGGLRFFTQ